MRKLALLCLLLSCSGTPKKTEEAADAHGSMAQKPRSTSEPAAKAADRTEEDRKLAAGREPPRLRLPQGPRPLRYAASLDLDPDRPVFSGQITIELSTPAPLPVLWLNADGLSLNETEPKARILDGGKDFVGLEFEQPLPAGTSKLVIRYQGKVSDIDTDGAFRQREGVQWYLLSHFEPTGARRVFPCFDEPAFKVPWQLTLTVPAQDQAFSNTLPGLVASEGARATVRFAETAPLPSYLLAFGVGPFETVAGSPGRTPVRIVVTRGHSQWAGYSAKSSPALLDLEADYFGIPYRYGKLDLIEVPVGTGAMENPGLNTFLSRINLVKPGEETPQFQRTAASVEAHEFAHQWFGDLVTTAWWDDLWLNEAFATWMTPKALDAFAPKWDAAASRIETRGAAMRADSLMSARRIRQPIKSVDDIKTAFDGITYQKGASVIAMFEAYVGAEPFRKGVRRYLAAHADGNATAQDFLAAISAEAGRDVAPAFSTFLDQAGVPLVSATLACNGGSGTLLLSQERSFPVGAEPPPEAQTWQIPVCAKFSARGRIGRACTLLAAKTGELMLPSCPDWVLPNEGETGYYRLLLEPSALALLSKNAAKLSGPERLGLLDDVVASSRAGKIDAAQMLAFLSPFAADRDRHVAAGALGAVAWLRDKLVPEAQLPQYAKLVRDLFGRRARALGFQPRKGEDEEIRLLRPQLIETVGEEGEDPQLAAEARKLAGAWHSNRAAVSAEMVPAVLALAAAHGDRAFFDQLRSAARATQDRADRQRMLGALGSFRDPALAGEAQALVLSDDLDPRETFAMLTAQASHAETRPAAYDFVKANFDALVKRLPRDAAAGFPSFAAGFCDDGHLADATAFFKDRAPRFVGGPRRLSQALETVRLCSALRKQQSASVGAFLDAVAAKSARLPPRR